MRSLDNLRVQAFDVLAVHSGCPFGGSAIAVPGVDLSLARSSGGVQASLSLAVWGCPALTDRRSAPRPAIDRRADTADRPTSNDCHAMNRGLRRSRSRRDRRADPRRRLHCRHDTAPNHSASPDQCADRRSTISKAAGQEAVRSTDPPRVSQVRFTECHPHPMPMRGRCTADRRLGAALNGCLRPWGAGRPDDPVMVPPSAWASCREIRVAVAAPARGACASGGSAWVEGDDQADPAGPAFFGVGRDQRVSGRG